MKVAWALISLMLFAAILIAFHSCEYLDNSTPTSKSLETSLETTHRATVPQNEETVVQEETVVHEETLPDTGGA